jgi:methanogenic corrinoid protein MtbC1
MRARIDDLIRHIGDLDEEEALSSAQDLAAGGYPGHQILRRCLEGLQIVGEKYEKGLYYASALVMAGEIMYQILDMVPIDENTAAEPPQGGRCRSAVLGTIAGDIHALGKDLVSGILRGHGFAVHDLGVDIAPEVFLAEAIRRQPDIVGVSILMSSSYPALLKTVELLKTMIPNGHRQPGVIVGGGAVNETVYLKSRADLWCPDLLKLPDLCHDWLKRTRPDTADRIFTLD